MKSCHSAKKDDYIKKLAAGSRTPQHELITECLEHYGVIGLRDLTEKQLQIFTERRLKNVFTSINTKPADETGV